MPGIVGVVRCDPWGDQVPSVIERMAKPMVHLPDQPIEPFVDETCAGAVARYGPRFGFLKSPIARRNGVMLWMAGEVYPDAGDVPAELAGDAPCIQRAEYCLDLYLKHGPDFVKTLNGAYAMAVYDRRDRVCRLYTDRLCTHAVYYCLHKGELVFGTTVKSLLSYSHDIGREYDKLAVAELVALEQISGTKTLFGDIHRLDTAMCACWRDGRLELTRYWGPLERTHLARIRNPRDAGEELVHRLRRAMAKRLCDQSNAAVFLSAGLDSRLVLATAPRQISSVTLANEGELSAEARRAARIARTQNSPIIYLRRSPDYYAHMAEPASVLLDGVHTFVGCHMLGVLDQVREHDIHVCMTGLFFDRSFKLFFKSTNGQNWTYAGGPELLRRRWIARQMSQMSVFRTPDRLDLMMLALNDEMRDMVALARERHMQEFMCWARDGASLQEQMDRMIIHRATSAGTGEGISREIRTQFIERQPIFENDVWTFGLEVPCSFKRDSAMVRNAISIASPALARIPDNNTGLPAGLGWPWNAWLGTARRSVRAMARGASRFSRRLASMRRTSGHQVFTHESFHDLNAALRHSGAYRALVDRTIDHLDEAMFDVGMIRHLLAEDLAGPTPQLRTLYETLITFATFDRQWGPGARRQP